MATAKGIRRGSGVPLSRRRISNTRICGAFSPPSTYSSPDRAAFSAVDVRRRHVVHIGERPVAVGADDARQPAAQVIADQPSDEVAFG